MIFYYKKKCFIICLEGNSFFNVFKIVIYKLFNIKYGVGRR